MDSTISRPPAARCLTLLCALGLLAAGAGALAADKDNNSQLRGLQQRVRMAEQAKAQLAQQKAELDEQVKAAAEKLQQSRRGADVAERKRSALAKELEAANAENSALTEKLAALEAQLAEAQSRGADTQAQLSRATALLGRSESNNRQLVQDLARRSQSLDECSARNENLFRVGAALLGQYEAKGGGRLLEAEPVTGLARVAVENRVEEMRDLLDPQRLAAEQAHKDKLRLAAQKKLDEERAAREQAEQKRLEQERLQLAKAKQQSDLDKLTRRLKSYVENLEW